MKPRLFLRLILLAVLLTSACASETPIAPAQTDAPVIVESSATPIVEIPSATLEVISTESVVPTALPLATSRGPELHATDPTTVSLASGQLQFVEFFRFT
jgi:hypothetical protein